MANEPYYILSYLQICKLASLAMLILCSDNWYNFLQEKDASCMDKLLICIHWPAYMYTVAGVMIYL